MAFETWLAFFIVEMVLCFIPGPAVLFVVSQAAWRGPRSGFAAAGGIAIGNLIYYVLSALGLVALIAASHAVFLALKWIGAAYLVWLGVTAIVDSFRKKPAKAQDEPAPRPHAIDSLRDAVIVQLANPKAMLFFAALLPQFIDPNGNAPLQFAILGLTTTVTELIVLSGYTLLASAGRKVAANAVAERWMKRGVGGIFLALGAAAALYRRAA
jgi:homoserine/homoserine lactone efflux protein